MQKKEFFQKKNKTYVLLFITYKIYDFFLEKNGQ
jgi:hypothetical protein